MHRRRASCPSARKWDFVCRPLPVHWAASLLASVDDAELDAFLARIRPQKLTDQTVIDKKQLRRTILKARADGFSLVDQEVEVGFRSISVALKRLDGKTIAALNVGIHSERGTPDMMQQTFLPKLQSLASELQQQLI